MSNLAAHLFKRFHFHMFPQLSLKGYTPFWAAAPEGRYPIECRGWTDRWTRYPLHCIEHRPSGAAALLTNRSRKLYITKNQKSRARVPMTIYCPWTTGYIYTVYSY